MSANHIRYTANAVITVFCLLVVLARLASLPASGRHLLWGGVAVVVSLLDIYFLVKSSFNRPKDIDTSPYGFLLGVVGSLGFVGSAVAIGYPVPDFPLAPSLRQAGGVVALLPYPFILWALLCLKDCLTVLPEAHGVVAHGIYKYSRHPLYMCYIVWAAANIMMFPSLPMIAVSVAHIAILVLRLKREEKLLLATFPEYRDYHRRTGLVGSLRFRLLLGE
ncbi:methyltransferase family protein [Anaeroselena agilis]|uniref:Isoprenylcysteine carboxylmethyltransferase family protein n=1 Tax=Anaeroselena agilis TaxID=3063788 RepID=A0ABU3P565_9FIRM|nr:isoprenylcysteine carboxylmethyltransferase family protein [Selenomonadales bacterium 4137-cl]